MKQLLLLVVVGLLVVAAFCGPGVDPDKPVPPAPIPNSIRMVMILAESGEEGYTPEQKRALASAHNGEIRQWMNGNTKKDGIRIFDPDEDVSGQEKIWQDAFNEAKSKPLPLVETYNGRRWLKEKTFADSDELKRAIGEK